MWFNMWLEISGVEPETKICKINVLPIKPYPLKPGLLQKKINKFSNKDIHIYVLGNTLFVIQETTWTFTVIHQRILRSLCLPIPALGPKHIY